MVPEISIYSSAEKRKTGGLLPMRNNNVRALCFTALMAAMTCVLTFLRIPLGASKVHLANAMCLLCGLLLGGVRGGVAAGFGSALYDVLWGGYDPLQAAITFIMKFAMAWVCAGIAGKKARMQGSLSRVIPACIAGALTYVALYMGKTFLYQRFVYGFPPDAVWATMLAKLPASLINAAFAVLVAPLIYRVVLPTFRKQNWIVE